MYTYVLICIVFYREASLNGSLSTMLVARARFEEEALTLGLVLSEVLLPTRVSLRFWRLTVLGTKLNQGATRADHEGLVLGPLVWGARRRRVVISTFLV